MECDTCRRQLPAESFTPRAPWCHECAHDWHAEHQRQDEARKQSEAATKQAEQPEETPGKPGRRVGFSNKVPLSADEIAELRAKLNVKPEDVHTRTPRKDKRAA